MTARDLLQRTPVRLAATFSALFMLAFLALFTVLSVGISARIDSDMRRRVVETADAIVGFDDPADNLQIVDIVEKEAASVRESDFIFMLVDDKGTRLAGNVMEVPEFSGWRWFERDDLTSTVEKSGPSGRYLMLWRPLARGRLLVGLGNREIQQIGDYLVNVLGYGLAGTTLVIGLMSMFLARQAQRRINAFAQTLAAVSRGQISARVPMSGSGDDIDQVATQVNRTLAQLQTLIENVNQSSSDIAHDLKRPIARMRLRLDETIRKAATADQMKVAIEELITDLDSITATFDALLNITQIEAGARRSRFQTVDLERIVEDVFELYAPVAEDAGHVLKPVKKSGGPFLIMGDAELLTQLIANLIENSVCHTPVGTTLGLQLDRLGGKVRLTMSDNGPGIPEHERDKVFQRLYRVERARTSPGSGLGLSLAHAIAELHNAHIALEDNKPGVRAIVDFLNPLTA
jgi:signal transduction histidine kinase